MFKKNVCPTSIFGDDNCAAVAAQIDVLENNLDNDDIYNKYDHVNSSEYILEAALDARQWLDDENDLDDEKLADSWPLKKELK